jgi:DNA gyrase subunit A
MRYTEARLSPVGEEMLKDIEKDTVDTVPNFDSTLSEPTVLPALLPNLLVNGVGGIAVGMATNIPPHNLSEIADAIAYLVDHYTQLDDVSVEDLMAFVPGPDFPTGALVLGNEGIKQAYATGKGRVICRARMHVEDLRSNKRIVVTELPYQVNKANLVERIATLVREGRVEGIADLRDESDRAGMRVVIELKRGVEAAPVLSQLFRSTQMQSTFGVNMLALVDGEPRVLSLKRTLLIYIDHRFQVLTRRTQYELEKALARAHVLEGLRIALDNLDAVIDTIRRSRTAETAMRNLCEKFSLTEIQARAILDLQLRRLAAMERRQIEEEYQEVLKRVAYLRGLLADKKKVLALVKEDILDLKQRFGDARRTHICEKSESGDLSLRDLVPNGDAVIALSRMGFVRRLPAGVLERREDLVKALKVSENEGDAPLLVLRAGLRENVLFFTDKGRGYQLPVHQLPDGAQQPDGMSVAHLTRMDADERVVGAFHTAAYPEDHYLALVTRQGQVKRLALSEISSLGTMGGEVIGLTEGDQLGWVMPAQDEDDLVIVSAEGRAIRFQASSVRPQGTSAQGMRGINLKEGDTVAGADVVREKGELVLLTATGFAKRTAMDEYSQQGRGGVGVLAVDPTKTDITGPIADAQVVVSGEGLVVRTARGASQLVPLADVPALSRDSWGRVVTRTRRGAIIQVEEGTAAGFARVPAAVGDPEKSAAPAPAKKTTTRRSAAAPKATGDDGAAAPARRKAASATKAASSAAEAPAAKAEPARRKASTDKAAQARPARATSRSAKAGSAEAAADQPKAEPAADAAPSKKPTARSRKASDSTAKETSNKASAEAAPEGESTPEDKPTRTRRTRRATVTTPPRRSRSSKTKAS